MDETTIPQASPPEAGDTQSVSDAKEKIAAAVKAYREFMKEMTNLQEEERTLFHETIHEIDDEKMKKIRETLSNM